MGLISNLNIENGKKLPRVALYKRHENEALTKKWADCEPKIANCFTNDINDCNTLLWRLSKKGSQCLELGLTQIEHLKQIGLHHIEIDEKLVRNAY